MPSSQTKITHFFDKGKKVKMSAAQRRAIEGNKKITDFFRHLDGVRKYQWKQHRAEVQRFVRAWKKRQHSQPDAMCTRNGFLFVATDNYAEYRVYTTINLLVIKDGNYRLIRRGTEIAEAVVDDGSALEHIEVKKHFRRQGIGTNLIRFIAQHCPQFHVYVGLSRNSRYRLAEEGAALINSCRRKEILSTEQVIVATPPPSPTGWR